MSFCFYDNDYDVRVSSFPTIFGERFVLRILPRICPYTWEELVSCPEEEAAIQRMLSRPGLVLLTGPTGSGKSTTLACILKALLTEGRTAVTVEDPVEYLIEGAQQLSPARKRAAEFRRSPQKRAAAGSRHHHGGRDPR